MSDRYRHGQTRRGFCAAAGAALFRSDMAMSHQSGSGAPTFSLHDQHFQNTREIILRATARGELPGIVTLVQDYGKRPRIEVAGWRDVDGRERMHADTIFDLRSITKTVTALASLLLVADKKLSLDEPVERYLPSIRSMPPNGAQKQSATPSQQITLRHLLTHTSGLSPSRPPALAELTEKRDVPLPDVVSRLVKEPAVSEPGSKWVYSSPGYALVGRIVEVVSREPLEEFVTQRILAPLGMGNTAFNPSPRARRHMATLYEWKNDRLVRWPRTMPAKRWPYTAPDFGLYSTATDVSKLLGSMLPGARCLLPEALRASMLAGTVATDVPGLKQGLGWMVSESDQLCESMGLRSGCFGHNGAFGSMAWASTSDRRVVVFLTQCLHASSPAGVSVLRATLC